MGAIVDLGFFPHLHVDDYTNIPCLLKESSSYIGHVFFGMVGNTRANYQKKLLNWGMKRAPKKNTLSITRWQLSSFHFSLCQQNKLLINFRILKYITKSHHQTFSPNLHGWHQMDCPPEIQRLDSINNKNIIWITLYNEGTERCRFTSRTV